MVEIPVEIASLCRNHPTEDVLEEYAFGRVEEARAGPLEEHLLICVSCQAALQDIDDYIRLVKAAAARPALQPISSWFTLPRWEWAVAFALALTLILVTPRPSPNATAVSLESYRGNEAAIRSHAPARHPLDLLIDATGLPPAADYRADVVTESGRVVWSRRGTPVAGKFTVHITPGLLAGNYWVRVYGDGEELLSEYGLTVD